MAKFETGDIIISLNVNRPTKIFKVAYRTAPSKNSEYYYRLEPDIGIQGSIIEVLYRKATKTEAILYG